MQHQDVRRVLSERLSRLLELQKNFPVTLRPYQIETVKAMRNWLDDRDGTWRAYVEHPTGTGKTILFAAIAAFCTGLRMLVIVPTKVLVEQTAKMMAKITGGMLGHMSSLQSVMDDNGNIIAVRGCDYADIVITTDESLACSGWLLENKFKPHIVIFDECHWACTGSTRHRLERYAESVIIGFSATPDYLTTITKDDFEEVELENGQVLYAHPERLAKYCFGSLLDKRNIRSCIEDGWLSPLAWGSVSFDVSLDSLPVNETGIGGYDYQDLALKIFMDRKWSSLGAAVRRIYKTGEYELPQRQTFAVCPSVATAEELSRAISDIGIPAACITGRTTTAQRHEIFAAYAAKKIKLLTSVMVLREGWDAPLAEVCLMLRPTRSRVVYVQTAGRVLRPGLNGFKKVSLILDGRFADTKFAPLTAPVLFAPVGGEVREGDVIINVRRDAPGPALPAEVSPYLRANARHIQVEQIPIEFRV